jgi:hypothetical protein
MGVHFPSVSSTTFIGPLPASATETVVLTTPPINLSLDNAQVIIHWFVDILAGTNAASHIMRIRRGTTTGGTLIGASAWFNSVTAGNQVSASGTYVDTPGVVGGQQYSLTIVQSAATGAGTFNDGALVAYVL